MASMRSRETRYATVSSCLRIETGPPFWTSLRIRGSWLCASLTEYVLFMKDLRTAGVRDGRAALPNGVSTTS